MMIGLGKNYIMKLVAFSVLVFCVFKFGIRKDQVY